MKLETYRIQAKMLQPKQIPYPIQGRTLRNQGPNSLYATHTYRTRSGNEPASIGGREGGNRFSQQAIHMIISGHNSGNMDRLAWRGLGRGRTHAHTQASPLPVQSQPHLRYMCRDSQTLQAARDVPRMYYCQFQPHN